MDYSVGSRVRVRLYSGKVVEAEITAITSQSAGRKVQIPYGSVTPSINPEQIVEVLRIGEVDEFGCMAADFKPRVVNFQLQSAI
jgi:hypothetical protein